MERVGGSLQRGAIGDMDHKREKVPPLLSLKCLLTCLLQFKLSRLRGPFRTQGKRVLGVAGDSPGSS